MRNSNPESTCGQGGGTSDEVAQLRAEVAGIRARAAFASEASMALLSAAHDVNQILDRLTHLIVPKMADGCVVYLASPSGELRQFAVVHADPAKKAALERYLARVPPEPRQDGDVYTAYTTNRAVFHETIGEDLLRAWAPDAETREHLNAIGARSALIVPMVAHGRSTGVLAVGTTEDRAFSPEDVELFDVLAQKVALAIDNANLYASERRIRLRTELLQGLTTRLARSLTSDDVAAAIVDHGVAIGASFGAIWTVDAEQTKAVLTLSAGNIAPDQAKASVSLLADCAIGRVLRTGEPLFFESERHYDAAMTECGGSALTWSKGTERMVLVPLVVAERRLGVVAFGFDRGASRAPDDLGFLLVSTGYAAQALDRANLFQAERKARREVSLLYDLLDQLNKAQRLEDVFEPALEAVGQSLETDRASILLFDDHGVMRFRAWRGLSDGYRQAVEGHSPWPFGALDPEPVVTPDVEADPTLEPYLPLLRSEGIGALAFIPLVHQRELLGKLMVYSRRPRQFSHTDLRLAGVIASQIAYAVARRVAVTQAENARLAAERANRLKDEFLAVVSHELRTPLSAIVGWAAILRDQPSPDTATLERGLDVILRNAKAQARLVEDILDVSRIITGKLVIDQSTVSLLNVVPGMTGGCVAPRSPPLEARSRRLEPRGVATLFLAERWSRAAAPSRRGSVGARRAPPRRAASLWRPCARQGLQTVF